MKNGLTELVFILDRSSSMSGLEQDTIGGFNSMIARQKEETGYAEVTTVLFDDKYEVLHDQIPLEAMKPLTTEEYFVRGSTALLDAVGRTIGRMDQRVKALLEEDKEKVAQVLFVITTDGMENASRHYSLGQVRQLIEARKEKYNWEFIFLGANIDAIETAESFGIDRSRAADFHADSQGVATQFLALSEVITSVRNFGSPDENWKKALDEDFKKKRPGKS